MISFERSEKEIKEKKEQAFRPPLPVLPFPTFFPDSDSKTTTKTAQIQTHKREN